jgi:iron complex outermembrane recepter protein
VKNTRISKFKYAAAPLALSLVLMSAPSFAQDAAPGEKIVDDSEAIIVTGSRIVRPELEASTPIQVVSSESIASQGSQNISDILNELPAVGIGTSRTNTNFSTSGNGQATVNLRNLGANRTLVLQNGRRIVAGIGGSSAVDLNTIPTELISRVEILTGGASAVYGSEAMSGVVNFILKDDFVGVAARAQAGISESGDIPTQLLSATLGANFADDAGNITVFGQYDNDGGLRSRDRAISAVDNPFRSGFTPQGSFFVGDNTYTYNSDNTLKLGFVNGVDGFNRNGERYISVPVERYLVSVLSHYDFNDNIGLFFEGSYSKTKSNSRLEGSPLQNADAVLPDGTISEGLSLDNPFIPATILADLNAQGETVLPFRKRQTGVFDRSNRNDREFIRLVGGIRGTLGSNFKYDAYYNYGQTTESTGSESAFKDRFYYALDAIAGPNGAICRDAAARAAGCVAYNPFGFNSVSPEAANYITKNGQLSTYEAKVTQSTFGANITGPIFKLPAGDVSVAAGVERRTEKSSEVFDLETQLGNTTGNALTNTVGKYRVFEAYAETNVPILADVGGFHYLGLEGAIRYADYTTAGKVFSWKAGATYAPIPDIRFRGVYSVATRAPNIGELFSGASQTFPNGIQDPCEGVTLTSTRSQDAYCRTLAGIAQQIAGGGAFTYNPNSDIQSIEGTDSGNISLFEEKAKTLTFGAVFKPSFIRNFSATVDFFDIRITDAIQQIPRNTIISQCVNSAGASPLCALIVREGAGSNPRTRTPGTVFQVDSFPVNSAGIKTRGIDVAVNYKTPSFSIGEKEGFVSFNLAYTYLDRLTIQPVVGLAVENNRGQLDGDGRLGAGFKHKANLSTTFDFGGASLNWRVNYLSSIKDTLGPDADSQLGDSTNSIKARFYHDAQLRFNVGEEGQRNIEFYAGVDNVFDKKPPVINQNGASSITGTETAADTFDPYGRRFYAGASVKF